MTSDPARPDASIVQHRHGEIDHLDEELELVARALEAPRSDFAAGVVDGPSTAGQRSWFVHERRTTHP